MAAIARSWRRGSDPPRNGLSKKCSSVSKKCELREKRFGNLKVRRRYGVHNMHACRPLNISAIAVLGGVFALVGPPARADSLYEFQTATTTTDTQLSLGFTFTVNAPVSVSALAVC
jgi:hypothetical protein